MSPEVGVHKSLGVLQCKPDHSSPIYADFKGSIMKHDHAQLFLCRALRTSGMTLRNGEEHSGNAPTRQSDTFLLRKILQKEPHSEFLGLAPRIGRNETKTDSSRVCTTFLHKDDKENHARALKEQKS
jgi:hypothetical protein